MKTPRFWRAPSLLGYMLFPLSWIYRLGVNASLSHHTSPARASIPVLSIGNVTAGGAGKTPTALALLPLLQSLGFVPHAITRGYKAKGKPLRAHRVLPDDTWETVGDEALLLAARAPTWVGRERYLSIRTASREDATLAVCDDALQHHMLYKDLSLLVIDGPYGLGNGLLLPAGPLRESLGTALARCHAVILIGEDRQRLAERIALPIFRAHLAPTIDTASLIGARWLAFAGIGRPEKFFTTLHELGANIVAARPFPDHHPLSHTEFAALVTEALEKDARLITTEKDAVKLTPEQRAHVTVLPVALTFEDPAALTRFLADSLAIHEQP